MIGLVYPVDGQPRLTVGPASARVHNLCVGAALVLACTGAAFASLIHGTTALAPGELAAWLTGTATADTAFALGEVRLPRILLGLASGFVIAMSGAVLQSLARNPLADPGLLGISQGAIVATMALMVLVPTIGLGGRTLAAVLGAVTAGGALLLMVGPARTAGLALILMGIALETVLSGATMMLLVHTPPEISYQLAAWAMGALDRASWDVLRQFAVLAILAIPFMILAGPSLRAYDLGDDLARSVGEPTGARRALILITVVFLTGASTAAVGPLVFLGIMAPHLAGFLSPASGMARLLLSGLMGAFLVTLADMGARLLSAALPLPLGLCLVLLGVPLFVITLRLAALRRS